MTCVSCGREGHEAWEYKCAESHWLENSSAHVRLQSPESSAERACTTPKQPTTTSTSTDAEPVIPQLMGAGLRKSDKPRSTGTLPKDTAAASLSDKARAAEQICEATAQRAHTAAEFFRAYRERREFLDEWGNIRHRPDEIDEKARALQAATKAAANSHADQGDHLAMLRRDAEAIGVSAPWIRQKLMDHDRR